MKKVKKKPPFDDDENQKMHERTGRVKSNDPLESFLYIVMRDGDIAPGRIEEVMEKHVTRRLSLYSNGHLARYAKDVAERLRRRR